MMYRFFLWWLALPPEQTGHAFGGSGGSGLGGSGLGGGRFMPNYGRQRRRPVNYGSLRSLEQAKGWQMALRSVFGVTKRRIAR